MPTLRSTTRIPLPGIGLVLTLLFGSLLASPGCQELVHMGQISDRESAFAINDARIEQQTEDGGWKLLGKTDGGGRWWIMKQKVKGGGAIRITKPGYYSVRMGESEFLQSMNLIMIPTGGAGAGDELDTGLSR